MISKDRDVEFHQKSWGHEIWMANNNLYCGKLLVVYRDLRCSIHYHKIKHETFYIQSGLIEMRVWGQPFEINTKEGFHDPMPKCRSFLMHPGDRLVIPTDTPHQFIGVAPESTIIETSTQHFEDDSYRIHHGTTLCSTLEARY